MDTTQTLSGSHYAATVEDATVSPVRSAGRRMTPRTYVLVALATLIALSGGSEGYARYKRVTCWSGGYHEDAWMAYCNSDRYGVYDTDAIWYGLEPEVMPAVREAKVLTLSDSHLQNALSLGGASEWFAARGYPVYMLGLPTAESRFGEMLLERLQANPAVVIFDASPYFTGHAGPFAENLLGADEETGRERVKELRDFQHFHRGLCDRWPGACGQNFAYFRSRKDGHWVFPDPSTTRPWIGAAGMPNNDVRFAVSTRPDELARWYPHYRDVARAFVRKLGLPTKCVVITNVPSDAPKRELAMYLSRTVGMTLIDPDVRDLATFDRAHLTPESSQRWTQAFLEELTPVLRECVGPGAAQRAAVEHVP
jgi:hypothetical protein